MQQLISPNAQVYVRDIDACPPRRRDRRRVSPNRRPDACQTSKLDQKVLHLLTSSSRVQHVDVGRIHEPFWTKIVG